MAASALALVTFNDELWSGVAVVAAPEVERLHAVDHAQYTLWVFAVPMLASTLIEAPIALLSDRWPRRIVLACGLIGLGVSLGLCALAHSAWLLASGLSLAGAASGVACGAAQAELVSTFSGGAQRALSRWIAVAAAGDALTPLAVAAAFWLGGTHRATFAGLALATLISGLLVLRRARCTQLVLRSREIGRPRARSGAARGVALLERGPTLPSSTDAALGASSDAIIDQSHAGGGLERAEVSQDDEPVAPLMAAVRSAARRPDLWLLLCASATCILLDEVVVALSALRLHELGWGPGAIAGSMSLLSCGGIVGALLNERLLGLWSPPRLMVLSALGSVGCLMLFIAAPTAPIACASLFLLGICAAPHYPLVQASAYELIPRQPGVVNALAEAFVALELLMPLAVGALAERYGLAVALGALMLQPSVVLLVASRNRGGARKVDL